MAKSGRPKVLDEEKRTLLCGLVGMGCTRKQAARHIGIGPTTLYEALREDKEFAGRLRRSVMNQDITPLRRILDHSQKSWRAAAWILERQDPDRYARRPPRTITVTDMHDVMVGIVEFLLENVGSSQDRQTMLERIKQLRDDLGGKTARTARAKRAMERLKGESAGKGDLPASDAAAGADAASFRTFRSAEPGAESAESRAADAENGPFEQGAGN